MRLTTIIAMTSAVSDEARDDHGRWTSGPYSASVAKMASDAAWRMTRSIKGSNPQKHLGAAAMHLRAASLMRSIGKNAEAVKHESQAQVHDVWVKGHQ